jgi:[protein-PII] uridylyltransferase
MAPSDMLMRRYYLAAKAIWRFNQILLANLFDRATPDSERKVVKLDDDFQVVNVNLEIVDEKLFEKRPGMILEAFRRLQDHRQILGLGPTTLRALSRALPKIGRQFREDPANRRAFMELLRAERLTWTLRRMSRYGVLGRYISAASWARCNMTSSTCTPWTSTSSWWCATCGASAFRASTTSTRSRRS